MAMRSPWQAIMDAVSDADPYMSHWLRVTLAGSRLHFWPVSRETEPCIPLCILRLAGVR